MPSYHHNSRKHQPEQTFFEVLLVGFGRLIVALFKLIFRRSSTKTFSLADKQYIIAKRHEVEAMLESSNVHELRQAVFEADKLVDYVLKAKGYQGETFADRLRSANRNTDRNLYDQVWQGHKIRNQLAHEHESEVRTAELKEAASKLLHYTKF